MHELVEAPKAQLPADLVEAVERASAFAEAAKAENTRRAYATAWAGFSDWCAAKGVDPLPASPSTVGVYLADAAQRVKYSTLTLRLAAISSRHRAHGFQLDTRASQIRDVMRGIARVNGSAVTKKDAATAEILRDALRAYAVGDRLKAKRDRAILAIGFFAALRRSELVAIDVEHVSVTADGLVLRLPRRKTDQAGAGTEIGLPVKSDPVICPVKAFKDYVEAAGITEGPLFRSISKYGRLLDQRLAGKDVARIVKAATEAAGYDAEAFSGHSLRSGFITSAARAGVADRLIMKQTGHKRLEEMHGYIRRAGLFTENAADLI